MTIMIRGNCHGCGEYRRCEPRPGNFGTIYCPKCSPNVCEGCGAVLSPAAVGCPLCGEARAEAA